MTMEQIACLKGIAVQFTDVIRKLLHIFCDPLVCIGQSSQGGRCIVSPIAAVLLMKMM